MLRDLGDMASSLGVATCLVRELFRRKELSHPRGTQEATELSLDHQESRVSIGNPYDYLRRLQGGKHRNISFLRK